MDDINTIRLGKDCCNQEIIPIQGKKLSMHTNRHPNCDGSSWGWIEGCTLNICWSNNHHWFNQKRASELVRHYNEEIADGTHKGDEEAVA